MKKLLLFFDRLEDKIRRRLSHKPLLYALLGGIGVVIFWRGVWHTADYLSAAIYFENGQIAGDLGKYPWWDGIISFVIGSALLLATGAFVSSFIGNEMIISGLKGEKKIAEKTEEELKGETETIAKLEKDLKKISERLADVEDKITK